MEFDSNDSPFLRLPAPLQDIIITTPLYSDGEAVIRILSDPRVYMNLGGPPHPYGQKEWDEWFPIIEKTCTEALAEYREAVEARKIGDGGNYWLDKLPVMTLRTVDPENGVQQYIGTISATRRDFVYQGGHEENERKQKYNDSLEAGNPEIEWSFGYYLDPAYHGRGIMSAAMGTLLHKFLVPYMNAHISTGSFFEYNPASRRVFEKNGFVFQEIRPDYYELPESKVGVKGKKIGVGFVKWTREHDF